MIENTSPEKSVDRHESLMLEIIRRDKLIIALREEITQLKLALMQRRDQHATRAKKRRRR